MAPKKKGANKKGGNDDWEAELGESIAPAAASPTGDAPAADEEESAGGGGLMNLMRKTKEKRKKKGIEDFVEGENAHQGEEISADTAPLPDVSTRQPEEANPDDEFALPDKKGKGGKGKQQHQKGAAKDEETDASGKVLTKAEKEKLKKEREKQRKKEQVGYTPLSTTLPLEAR
jgi:translation initiation factor 5B